MNSRDVKAANEARLKSLGVLVNEHLPMIEEPVELKPRSAQAVSARACALSHVIGVGYGQPGAVMLEWLTEAGLTAALSPRERELLKQKEYSDLERALAAWQVACVHSCAWALSLEQMDPLGQCPDTLASHFPRKRGPDPAACLRSFDEIYAEADFYYRMHWAARQARLAGDAFQRPEIEIELRRKALDWIVGLPYEWDEMPSDT